MGKPITKIESGKGYEIYSDGKNKLIKLLGVRVSFPHAGEQQETTDPKTGRKSKAWGVTAMLPFGTHEAAKDAFMKISDELRAANPIKKDGKDVPVKIAPENIACRNGDDKDRSEYEGHWIIAAKESKRHPSVRDSDGSMIATDMEIDRKFYGGCFANVMVRPWYFNGTTKESTETFPKRICAGFVGIQFFKDGEPFGEGKIDDDDAWGSSGEDESDDDGLSRTSKPSTAQPTTLGDDEF